MSLELLALGALVLASIPASMVAINLFLFQRAPAPRQTDRSKRLSLLFPARNEDDSIRRVLETACRADDPELEILVMDDHSEDATAAEVTAVARTDSRVRLLIAPALEVGWNGKQHACARLAEAASGELLVFVDADVDLEPDAVARIRAELDRRDADLVSGFPRQLTGSFLERLLIPLIHFVLLGFLPLLGMRRSPKPAFAAGCGQLMAVRREAYERAGGHRSIRGSRHDGLALPRALRRSGARTDIFDAGDLASCRMYETAGQVWRGLAKNATEGMATPGGILPWTLLLLGGQVAPVVLLILALASDSAAAAIGLAATAATLGYLTRGLLAWRFDQSWLGVLLHPLGVALLVAIQWYALGRELSGRPVEWKGRRDVARGEGRPQARGEAA